jgi:hypothetical protein
MYVAFLNFRIITKITYFYIISDVTDFLRSARPGEETRKLQILRKSLTARSNVAADQIKDIVFDHYRQFIDTSKEISSHFIVFYEIVFGKF